MSKINHQNIEQWLFDYSEGSLNASQIRELNNFIQVHPEYQLDLDAWTNAKVSSTEAAPYVYADQLLAISNTGYAKRYLAAAGIFLLFGSSALFYYTATTDENNETIANTNTSVNTENKTEFLSFNQLDQHVSKSNHSINNDAIVDKKKSDDLMNPSITENANFSESIIADHNTNTPIKQNVTQPIVKKSNGAPFIIDEPINKEPVVSLVEEKTIVAENQITTPNAEELIISEDLMPSKLFRQEPSIKTDKTGEIMAKKAFENLAANKTTKHNEEKTDNNTTKTKRDERIQNNKKRFNEFELGFFNNRDHQLLIPGNLNTAEYAAFAGSAVSPALSFNYRNNQTASDVSSQNMSFVYDQYSKSINSAWGIGASRNVIGEGLHTSNQAEFYFSPKIKINKTFTIEPALSASYHQNSMSSKVPVSGMDVEPYKGYVGRMSRPQSGGTSINGFDMTASALVNTKYFYAVAGVDHLLRPKQLYVTEDGQAGSRTEMRIKTTVGTDIKKLHSSRFSLSPQLSFIHQGRVNELWLGAGMNYDKLLLAASVAQNGQFFTSVGINAGILKINYNFDFTRSYLDSKYFGSHELSVRFALSGISKKSTTILNYRDN